MVSDDKLKKAMEQKQQDSLAKQILDKYRPLIIRKDKVYEKSGVAQVNTHEPEKYTPENYAEDIVLQIAPKDAIIIEFEDTPAKNKRFIAEMEESCRVQNIQCCITGHEGGKSQYLRIYNIKDMPVNYDNKIAKDLLIETLIPSGAKEQLDTTNIGWTLSPVIGHPHWKPKYKGAIHQIIRGTSPLEQVNGYPKEFLKKINKAKKLTKFQATEILRNNQWINDFLVNYCTNNLLPKGSRHNVIEKNLAALIYHRTDVKDIINRYKQAQERSTNTLRTWFNAISNGDYKEVSVLEIKRYIKDNNIQYEIPAMIVAGAAVAPAKPITSEEQTLLTDPNLLDIIDVEFDKTIVEEHESRKAIFLNACGKWVENANTASFNLCINSNSGAGKDYICKNVLKIFSKDDVQSRSRISPTALTYWHDSRREPDFTWDGKILSLMDISNSILNCDVFKLFCSDGSHSTVVIDQQACSIEIKGKPVMIITTATASPSNETLRRFPFLELDETVDQTKAIKKAQAKAAALGKTIGYNPLIAQALSKLKRVKVKVPFAEDLVNSFPDKHLIMRTHFLRLLDYIKANAALYQNQRETDEDGFIIAVTQDYDNAIILLKKTTSNPMMIPLSKKQKMMLDECKKLDIFSVKQLEPHVPFYVQSKLYAALGKLQDLGFLESFLKTIEESTKPVRHFQYISFELDQIPTWKEIQENCRKKGIEGSEGKKGIEGSEGNVKSYKEKDKENTMINNNKSNSPISPISPTISTSEHKKNDKKSIHKKIMEVKNYIEKVVNSGHAGVSDVALFDNFEAGIINGLFESGQLIKLPGTNLNVWSSG